VSARLYHDLRSRTETPIHLTVGSSTVTLTADIDLTTKDIAGLASLDAVAGFLTRLVTCPRFMYQSL
jgi:hypothetical protein